MNCSSAAKDKGPRCIPDYYSVIPVAMERVGSKLYLMFSRKFYTGSFVNYQGIICGLFDFENKSGGGLTIGMWQNSRSGAYGGIAYFIQGTSLYFVYNDATDNIERTVDEKQKMGTNLEKESLVLAEADLAGCRVTKRALAVKGHPYAVLEANKVRRLSPTELIVPAQVGKDETGLAKIDLN
jgi:hypothetical protein